MYVGSLQKYAQDFTVGSLSHNDMTMKVCAGLNNWRHITISSKVHCHYMCITNLSCSLVFICRIDWISMVVSRVRNSFYTYQVLLHPAKRNQKHLQQITSHKFSAWGNIITVPADLIYTAAAVRELDFSTLPHSKLHSKLHWKLRKTDSRGQ